MVVHGKTNIALDEDGSDPYEEPKRQDKFKIVDSGNSLTNEKLVERILARRLDYEARNAKKEKKEKAAYEAYMKSKPTGKDSSSNSNGNSAAPAFK